MKRKVIQLAGNTLIVSLPSKWVRANKVMKGDEMDIIEFEKKLVLSPMAQTGIGAITVDVSGLDAIDTRVLGALYKSGYDEVKAYFSSIEELKRLQEVIREEFIGFEIIDQKKNYLIFRKVSSIEAKEFNTMVRRVFLLILSASEDCLEAVKAKDYEWLQAIVINDKNINKVTDFCRRVLNITGTDQFKKIPPGYFMIEQLEKIADHYRDIAKHCIEKKVLFSSDLEKMFLETHRLFKTFYTLYFKFDLHALNDFVKERKRLDKAFTGLYTTLPKKELRVLHCLNSIADSTFDMNGPLINVNL